MKRLLQVLLMATIALNWGAFKGQYERGHSTHGRRFEMASVAVYLTRDLAEAALKEIQADWPAAKVVAHTYTFAIACDYAQTKWLRLDGFVY